MAGIMALRVFKVLSILWYICYISVVVVGIMFSWLSLAWRSKPPSTRIARERPTPAGSKASKCWASSKVFWTRRLSLDLRWRSDAWGRLRLLRRGSWEWHCWLSERVTLILQRGWSRAFQTATSRQTRFVIIILNYRKFKAWIERVLWHIKEICLSSAKVTIRSWKAG